MKFCPACSCVMFPVTTHQLYFHCKVCGTDEKANPHDFLFSLSTNESGNSLMQYFIDNASRDQTSDRVFADPCKNCGSTIRTRVRIGPEEKVYNLCNCS